MAFCVNRNTFVSKLSEKNGKFRSFVTLMFLGIHHVDLSDSRLSDESGLFIG